MGSHLVSGLMPSFLSTRSPDRTNKPQGNVRSRATVNRLKMYKSGGKAIRDASGKVLPPSAAP